MYLCTGPDAERTWSPQQAWVLVKEFASRSSSDIPSSSVSDNNYYTKNGNTGAADPVGNNGICLRYNEILLHDAFAGAQPDAVLQALEQAELISIVSSNGRPQAIKPGKPVFLPAFARLTADRVLRSRLDVLILAEQILAENATIDKTENELRLLGGLPKQPGELTGRIKWLLAKVEASQRRLEGWERDMAEKKRVLCTEF